MIEVSWDIGLDKQYTVELEIVCNDKSGILANILAVPTEMKINIRKDQRESEPQQPYVDDVGWLDVHSATQVAQDRDEAAPAQGCIQCGP